MSQNEKSLLERIQSDPSLDGMAAITILARLRAKRGMEDRLKKELIELMKQTKSEFQCSNYDLHQSIEDGSRFMFYENWPSKSELVSHLKSESLKVFFAKAPELLAESPEITFWERR